MLVGIDGRALLDAVAGTRRYVTELCRALHVALPEARFVIFSNSPLKMPVDSPRWSLRGDDGLRGRALSPFAWYVLCAGSLAAREGVDVFWGCANFLPLGLPRRIRAVVTVHDVVHCVFPQSMGVRARLAYGLFFRLSMRRAQAVACVSRGTSDRLHALGFRSGDAVVMPGVSAKFAPQAAPAIAQMREQLGLSRPYLLSVSTREPRKNLDGLVRAYLAMRQAGELPHTDLVLVGQEGWKTQALQGALTSAGEHASSIHVTGRVPDELLPALYAGAEVFVMPSFYEGFGIPVLEARMCGTPVVATDIPELREAGGDDAIYVSPTVAGIASGIRRVLAQEGAAAMRTDPPRWESEGLKLASLLAGHGVAERT